MLKNIVILLLASAVATLLWLRRPAEAAHLPAVVAPPPAAKSPTRYDPLLATIREVHEQVELAASTIGFCLIDSKGTVVEDIDGHTSFIPASSIKTVTTATALEILGPDFRFVTEVKASAPLKDGIIDGDLVIVGGGDPMLASGDLRAWAAQLKEQGLRQITGKLKVDATVFPGSIYGDFWNWGDIGNGYGSGVAGLNLDHNRMKIRFRPSATVGEPAEFVTTVPEVPGLTWKNEVITAEEGSGDGVVIHGGEGASTVFLRGTVPISKGLFQVTGAVPDPQKFALHHFRVALEAEGIQISDQTREASPATHSLITHQSPPLIEIITSIHASSDNQETECVFRMLGVKAGKPPVDVIRDHWKARGLDFTGLRMEDGCGLSRADFICPSDLARLQFLAGTGPHGAAYKASLLSDGGLRWKGGAMSGVRSYTGYVTTKSGEEFCYAFMVNHFLDGKAVSKAGKKVTDAMLGL